MLYLNKHIGTTYRALLEPRNYKGLYNKLSKALSEEDHRFFAQPDIGNNAVQWYAMGALDGKSAHSLSDLDDSQRGDMADKIEEHRSSILQSLKNDSELCTLTQELLTVPSIECVFVVESEYGLRPVLTLWGHTHQDAKSNIDPLEIILDWPRPNRQQVILNHQYRDGDPMVQARLELIYRESQSHYLTNEEGIRKLGCFKFSSVLSINYEDASREIIVQEGREMYSVEFPRFAQVRIKTLNQDGRILAGESIVIRIGEDDTTYHTNEKGEVVLPSLEVGTSVTAFEEGKPENKITFIVQADARK